MDYKDGKWAKKIISLQHDDGSWGNFHSLAKPTPKQPMTTEQALRRLEILGFTIDNKPIQKAIKYLNNCLIDYDNVPDHYEVGSDWKSYLELMVSTWILRFTADNKKANSVSDKWAEIVNASFQKNVFNQNIFDLTYRRILKPEKGKHIWGFMNFYGVSILANKLDKKIEPLFFEYVLNYPRGIYYFCYNKSVKILPEVFTSKKTVEYIRMMESLTKYNSKKCKEQLFFIKEWLEKNKINKNEWDLGKNSKDSILLPLSDSWRNDEDRIKDCTYIINKIFVKNK